MSGAMLTTRGHGVDPSPTSSVIVSPASRYGCTVLPSMAVLATIVAPTTPRLPRRYAAEDTTTDGTSPLSLRRCSIQK